MAITDWVESASADNATATATRAAESGREHHITAIVGSFDKSGKSATMTLKNGATTLFSVEVFEELDIEFVHPIRGTEGKQVSAELNAGGTAGDIGRVALMGYTI